MKNSASRGEISARRRAKQPMAGGYLPGWAER